MTNPFGKIILQLPDAPLANLNLAMIYTMREERDAAAHAFARAIECDQSLEVTRDRFEEELVKLQS